LDLLKPYQRRAWLYRTLKNLFLDQTRSYQREEALLEDLAWDLPAAGHLPQEIVSPSPFDLVPERYRELVEKRFILGMNSREIAEELGIPAATVRSRLHLAIKSLRARQRELR
jgi:RNA polymerase sigma-70 factor (ECF subfamily)